MADLGKVAFAQVTDLKKTIITPEQFGAGGSGVTDDTQAFVNAIAAANGKPITCNGVYNVSLNLTDEDIHLVGTGTLIHQQAKNVMRVKRTLGPAINITSIGTVQIGASLPATGISTEVNTKIVIPGSLAGIQQGDLYHIVSQDLYPFSTQMTSNKGITIQVWQAGFVPIHGIGLDYTGAVNGGFVENDTIVGATSGATALILSCSDNVLVFGKVTGDFISGENLQVGGTTKGVSSGTPYLIMRGKLIDTYTTSPVLRKVPTDKKFIIDGLKVKADGDVDTIVGSANRKDTFNLLGVYKPVVKNFTIESAWTRGFRIESCYQGQFDVFIKKLPNNANESEGAYGYGIELSGATEGCMVRVNGGNCRHAFTTNVRWGGFQFMDPLSIGTIKHNTVYDSVIKDAISASFDTHEGCYFTTFQNCRSINSRSGLRNTTASQGFQNRGFGTIYDNCHDNGSVVGFTENGVMYESNFVHYTRYINCTAINYQQYGFKQESSSVSNNPRLEFVDCFAKGDGSTVNVPYYQAGFYLRGGVTLLKGCVSARFNGTPYQFNLTSGRFNMIDCFADYFDTPTSITGLRFDGAPAEFNLQNYKVRLNPFGSPNLNGIIRVGSGAVVLNVDGISCVNSATPPQLAEVTGGSIVINYRSLVASVRPITTNGNVGVTLTPRSSTPTQIWNTPLTVDRTITLDTSVGKVINGDRFRIVRTAAATGAFNLIVGSGLKNLSAGQWCEVDYDGSSWSVTASGTL